MGKQIQIQLSPNAEERLIDFLSERFPHVAVVDSVYPENWDRQTLSRSPAARRWLIIDERVTPILLESSNPYIEKSSGETVWQVRSLSASCIEWNRDLYNRGEKIPPRGRLYVDTLPKPIGPTVTSEIGDTIDKMYNTACRWVRKHGTKETTNRVAIWSIL